MTPKTIQTQLGAGACLAALFLTFVGIPNWVSSPSNVPNIVLSPTFWPYVLTGLTGLMGLGLLFAGLRSNDTAPLDDQPPLDRGAAGRLAVLALIMGVAMAALPRLGMVWTTMPLFLATAFLFRTSHPRAAVVCALVMPLALYGFFAHVAGVSVPQGDFVRLP